MIDPTPFARSTPLPDHQTAQASRDPLPVSSPKAIAQNADVRTERSAVAQADAFQTYLDQTSITLVESTTKKRHLDAADLIGQQSVYVAPGAALGV
ncbi:hypothetical protein [uncultured Methylobacterium sp.]|uniref:hypothetical protein n=1 Tax=uncultured Methylobacterium sp. TaxID=157278 RepID=UPI0035CC5EAB